MSFFSKEDQQLAREEPSGSCWVHVTADGADRIGLFQPKLDTVLAHNDEYLVLKSHGYSENPGSRYSGLMSYYPPETTVYRVVRTKDADSSTLLRCVPAINWSNARKKRSS